MALAPLLYDITFDRQTRILYFWDKAGHEIYHCEIPSPAPALPTVQKTDTWEEGAYNWCYNSSHGSAGTTLVSIASNASSLLYFEDGSPIPYDSTKAYGPIFWKSDDDTINNFGCVIVNDSGYLAIKNITSSTITFQSCRCAVCSSNSVENITVYDSNNQPYFAWLFVSNGTNYYFVLRTETDWTDDLASIGYRTYKIYTGWCKSDHSNMNFSLWGECNLLDDGGNQITWASGMGNPTIYKLYNSNGDEVSANFTIQWHDPYYTGTYKLMIKCYESAGTSIAKVDYKLG